MIKIMVIGSTFGKPLKKEVQDDLIHQGCSTALLLGNSGSPSYAHHLKKFVQVVERIGGMHDFDDEVSLKKVEYCGVKIGLVSSRVSSGRDLSDVYAYALRKLGAMEVCFVQDSSIEAGVCHAADNTLIVHLGNSVEMSEFDICSWAVMSISNNSLKLLLSKVLADGTIDSGTINIQLNNQQYNSGQ